MDDEVEKLARRVAVDVMRELYGLEVTADEFIPFSGRGEAKFLGGVATKYGKNLLSNFSLVDVQAEGR
jgi:hypothetical protein